MAEFTKIMEIKKRMCASLGKDCENCPLWYENNGMNMQCVDLFHRHPDKTEEIIVKWDKEHLQKTRLTDFLEKYPNAKVDEQGVPRSCAGDLGYCEKCRVVLSDKCEDCWNTPLSE